MTDLSAEIDGVPCLETRNTSGRPDYHFNRSDSSTDITLSAYLHTGRGTHTYRFRYKLRDVVKNVEDSYCLFCFRPVGANFEKTVKSIHITVTAPEGCVLRDLYHSKGTVTINGTTAEYSATNRSGMDKLRLRMDGGGFGAIPRITAKESRENRSAGEIRRTRRMKRN